MEDDKIAEIMGWPRRYGWPTRELARCRALVEAAREFERSESSRRTVAAHGPGNPELAQQMASEAAALIQFARGFLDPEQFGYTVGAEIRDRARLALGMPAVECVRNNV